MKNEVSEKGLFLAVAIVVIVVTAIILIARSGGANTTNTDTNTSTNTSTTSEQINYTETEDGEKINNSAQVVADKKVGDILIENTKIVYSTTGSKLTAKVTNDSTAKDELKLKVIVVANDNTTLVETVALVGKVASNESKYIDVNVTSDISNAKNVTYELAE